jgi:uncharacterized membrane protein YoaK (UPF0700 family)
MTSITIVLPKIQRYRELLLACLTVSSGSIDAISFLALHKVFSAFMTGNVAFLGLRTAGASGPPFLFILSSMLAFAIGVFVSARIVGDTKEPALWSSRVTVALGVSLIGHTAFQVLWFSTNGDPSLDEECVLLALWAFSMGMQTAAMRSLHVDGVFTTAATGTIMLLVGRIAGWRANPEETRRFARVLFSLFFGAAAGGLLLVHAHLFAPLFSFVITIFAVITASVIMRQGDQQ